MAGGDEVCFKGPLLALDSRAEWARAKMHHLGCAKKAETAFQCHLRRLRWLSTTLVGSALDRSTERRQRSLAWARQSQSKARQKT